MRIVKHQIAVFLLTLLLPLCTLAQNKTGMKLEDYKWENRLLLVFSPSQDNAHYSQQMKLVRESMSGVKERDLLVLEVVPNGRHAGQRKELLEQFGVAANAYTLILLGKDGLEKYRSQQPVPLQEVFKIIDQMPMRRQEMRKQE